MGHDLVAAKWMSIIGVMTTKNAMTVNEFNEFKRLIWSYSVRV